MTIVIVLVLYTTDFDRTSSNFRRVRILSRDETTQLDTVPFVHERELVAMPNRAPARVEAFRDAQRNCTGARQTSTRTWGGRRPAPLDLGGAMSVWLVSAAGIIVATISATVALLVPRVTP